MPMLHLEGDNLPVSIFSPSESRRGWMDNRAGEWREGRRLGWVGERGGGASSHPSAVSAPWRAHVGVDCHV